MALLFFSSPGPKVSWGAYRMVASVVVRRHFQKTSLMKLLGQSRLNFIRSLQSNGERKLDIWSRSHDQDSRHAHIW